MHDPASTLIGFALSKLESETVLKRAEIYRAIAALAATPEEARAFSALAAECEALNAAHEQLVFNFHRSRKPGSNGTNGKN